MEKLGLWAMAGLSKQQQQQQDQQQQQQQQQPAVLGDADPPDLTAFLEEAKATYALGKHVLHHADIKTYSSSRPQSQATA